MNAPDGWPCQCLPASKQVGDLTEELDFGDLSWHQLGCHVRLNAAAMAAMGALFDVETLQGPRIIGNGLSERNVDDLYRMARIMMEVLEQYRAKEAHYGRTWAETGWLAQCVQIFRRARRLMVMGWWKYDETNFDEASAEQNAKDVITHAYFFLRLLQDKNRKGYVQ
jgi:hypothetical protein